MHGVRESLLNSHALSMGLTLEKIYISKNCTNEEYEAKMESFLRKHLQTQTYSVVFGDIFLEDVRIYREKNLSKLGIEALFPLWKNDSRKIAQDFIDKGFKAIITCVDLNALDKHFLGRDYDEQLIKDLPPHVDPCGENGEFHTKAQ